MATLKSVTKKGEPEPVSRVERGLGCETKVSAAYTPAFYKALRRSIPC